MSSQNPTKTVWNEKWKPEIERDYIEVLEDTKVKNSLQERKLKLEKRI